MERLLESLLTIPESEALASAVEGGGCPAALTGLGAVHRAQVAAAVSHRTGRPLIMLCADESEAGRLAGDLETLLGEAEKPARVLKLFARELFVRAGTVISRQWEHGRIAALHELVSGNGGVLVTTAEALLQKTSPPEKLREAVVTLEAGGRYDLEDLSRRLVDAGYSRADQVEGVGQFALRGGILDVYSPLMEEPVRCEFFDDEVDSLGAFDILTQRRTRNLDRALLLPAVELLPGVKPAPVFDYFPANTLLCVSETGRVGERVKSVLWQAREDTESLLAAGEKDGDLTALLLSQSEWLEKLGSFALCMLESLPTSRYPLPPRTLLSVSAKQLSAYGGSVETAAADMEHYRAAGYRTLLLCGNAPRAKSLQRMLFDRGLPAALDLKCSEMPGPGEVRISVGALSAGAEYPQISLAVLTEGQLTARTAGKPAPKKAKRDNRQKILSYADLSVGDLVVHSAHGVGRFEGIRKMPVDGVEKDYIKIVYAGGDSLYVPATGLDQVSKYIGGGGLGADGEVHAAKLNKLGGADWHKQKSKAKAAAKDLAKGLIALYAERQRRPGFAFSPDSPWQLEFEEAFDYVETEDQLRCIAEIKKDMEKPVPMERLLCGDVGYGKTEVALRAVMKCVRSGRVDLLIGTHKLIQKDVAAAFKDLGLLVVDEEQRFGVSHKERLKEMSRQVDVLTLSATPIPRTLNMALSGIRDMSTLEEPPQNRQPVQTYVIEHDWGLIGDAMRREIDRGGQVYYLHNRVESIDSTAAQIRRLVGEDVRVVTGHGKMDEKQLSSVMQQMVEGEAQVLVCTTIIETGIDIANVNTLIIEDADKMGLAQLHQIRGRIGRSARRAYAYMTYRPGKVLSEIANKRLTAIREYVEFGSGFKIAMRDLEIRGAGNLLGPEQSGYMMTVGYDMYLQLLEDAVLEEKGEKKKQTVECSADLAVSANIPSGYVSSNQQRMDLYRRIAAIRSQEDASDLLDELMDRYGDPPKPVYALLDVALLRASAARAGISDISQKERQIRFVVADFDAESIASLVTSAKYRRRLVVNAGDVPALTLTLQPKEPVLETALAFTEDLRLARESEETA